MVLGVLYGFSALGVSMFKRKVGRFLRKDESKLGFDLVVHIGAPKAGSSAIQKFCATHSSELERFGFYYPEHPLDKNGVSGGHAQVAGALINGKYDVASDRLYEWLGVAKEKNKTLLLSAEAFYGQYKQVANMCKGFNVKVVGFLRHPIDYMLGNHNQGIKRHMMTERLNVTLSEFIEKPAPHLVGKPFCGWADQFGDQNCVFMPYKPPGAGESLETDFLIAIGIPAQDAKRLSAETSVTNRSYVKSALELKRLLNVVLPSFPDSYAHRVDWCLQSYSDRATNETPYQVKDIPQALLSRLSENLCGQMSEVSVRFPSLTEVTTLQENTSEPNEPDICLVGPLNALWEEHPDIMLEVKEKARSMYEGGRKDYGLLKLLDILGVDFEEPLYSDSVLLPQSIEVLSNPGSQPADFLREMALMLERSGFLKDALCVIELAHSRRPNGEGIKCIKQRIQNKVKL